MSTRSSPSLTKTTPKSSFIPGGRNLLRDRSTEQAEPPLVPPILHDLLPTFQAKLTIGQPNDQYEQEADRVAEQVMRMSEPKIQRVCPECEDELQRQLMEEEEEEEETLQTKPLAEQITPLVQRQAEPMEEEEEEETLQTKTASGKLPTVSSSLQNRITALRGSGQPLPQSERAFFEPLFGTDFSQVRVHADSQAAETARTVNARAFTLGRDIVFDAGQYQPSVSEGRRLLAHELAHVVQQSRSSWQDQFIRRRVRRNYVSCENRGLWHPRRTGDQIVNIITTADARAIAVARNAETQISNLRRDRGTVGYTPPAVLRDTFQSRFNIDVATVSDRQLELIQSRFQRIRGILEGGYIRYTCRGGDCQSDDWAYSDAGVYRIYLCNRFYGDTENERGGTLLHEAFHIYFPHIEDWEAPALANAHCYEQFARLLLGDTPASDPCI